MLDKPQIDAETSAKILAADIANIVKKVKSGRPLSTTERKLIMPSKEATAPGMIRAPGDPLTINQLAQRNDSTPRTIKHWIEVLGIKPTRKGKRRFFSEVDEANIKPHLRSVKAAEASTNGPNIEADTGLTYAQALVKERAIKERRENEEAEAVQSKRWFPTDKMLEMFAAIVNRLEQLPGKVRSEAGLSETQMAVVQAKVDDTRRQIASDLEGLK